MTTTRKIPEVAISVGELIDKITILEIKLERIFDQEKRKNIRVELELLNAVLRRDVESMEQLDAMRADLKRVNELIWDLEDQIRDFERRRSFKEDFVAVARKVYRTNDERAAIKRAINLLLDSAIIEEKSYAAY